MKKLNSQQMWFIIILFSVVSFLCGWLIKSEISHESADSEYLRLGGYKYINPLLVCDTSTGKKSAELESLNLRVKELLEKEKAENRITQASVYYRDTSTGDQININMDEKYYPASLNKVPFMIAIMKLAEKDPKLLQKKVLIEAIPETNTLQEIKPADFAEVGKTYSVEELIEKMIIHSDNNAFYALSKHLDRKTFDETFSTFGINYPEDQSDQPDFITAYDFAYFLRVLYNATYLNRELSEKALSMMSRVVFDKGIKAGLPDSVAIAQKFGLRSDIDASGKVVSRELHNCGVVYAEKPYLLCVMTKSNASIDEIGTSLENISRTIYEAVETKS